MKITHFIIQMRNEYFVFSTGKNYPLANMKLTEIYTTATNL